MDVKVGSVKLNNFNSYNLNNYSNNSFNKKFYIDSKVDKTNDYENIDYSGIDVFETIDRVKKEEQERIEREAKAEQERIEREAKAEQERIEKEKKEKEARLIQLYKDRDDNNGLFHPIKEQNIENEILKLEKELGLSHKADGFEKFTNKVDAAIDTVNAFNVSIATGALELVENLGDGLIMAGGALASNVVSIWDDETAEKIANGTSKIVSYDWNEKVYDGMVNVLDIDEDIAYGSIHSIGSFIGTTAAYVVVSCIPGGAVVTAAAGACAAMGAASEQALKSGATFDEAVICGVVAGGAGAIAGAGLNKIQGLASTTTSLAGVAGYTLAGAGIASSEPIINSGTQYLTYGKNMTDENGNKIYNDFGDYYVDSGGLKQTVMASVVGGAGTGLKGIKSYRNNKRIQQIQADFDDIMQPQNRTSGDGILNTADRDSIKADFDDIMQPQNRTSGDGILNTADIDSIKADFDDIMQPQNRTSGDRHYVDPKASEFNASMDKWFETFSYKKDGDRLHDITELKNFISNYTNDLKLNSDRYLLSQKDIDDIVAIYYTRGTAEFDEISTILKLYSDDALYVSMDNYVWQQASVDSGLYGLDKIESYHYDSNKGIVIDYVARDNGGNTVNRSISRSVDDFDSIVLKDRDDLLIDMILHKEDDLIKAGKVISPIKEYDSLIHWNSAEEAWNNMTDVAKQEFLKTSPNIKIASDGTTSQFGFFSFGTYVDGNNITSLGIPDSTAIGKTQWSTELISLKETLSNTSTFETVSDKIVEVNVMNLSDSSVFTDQDIAELADVLTARPRKTKAQDIRFIAHDVSKTPLNVTSNSYAGANNQYAGNSSTMANVREINAGPVDKNTSIVLGVDGIRKMFIEMLK